MEFAVISPTAGLERYAKLSKTQVVLSQINQQEYLDFYKKRREADDLIILDNGAYEGMTLPIDNLKACIEWYDPQVVALPDFYLQSWRKTWHASIHFLDMYYDKFPDQQWLYVPQSTPGDLHGFISSYQEAAEDPRITWLGIPRCLPLHITDNPLARVEFAQLVRSQHPRLRLHAFGMVNGDVHELPYLAAAGVNSVDSSAPVWRGWNGVSLNGKFSHMEWEEKGTPVDFSHNVKGWESNHELILANLEACGVDANPRI